MKMGSIRKASGKKVKRNAIESIQVSEIRFNPDSNQIGVACSEGVQIYSKQL